MRGSRSSVLLASASLLGAGLVAASPARATGYSREPCERGFLRQDVSRDRHVHVRVKIAASLHNDEATLLALDSWQRFPHSPIRFDGAPRGWAYRIYEHNDGPQLYSGFTRWQCDSAGRFISGHSRYNTYFTYTYPSPKRQYVMAHEIGHALGLGHSGPDGAPCPTRALMYWTEDAYLTCGIVTPQLDDIYGIYQIYGKA